MSNLKLHKLLLLTKLRWPISGVGHALNFYLKNTKRLLTLIFDSSAFVAKWSPQLLDNEKQFVAIFDGFGRNNL